MRKTTKFLFLFLILTMALVGCQATNSISPESTIENAGEKTQIQEKNIEKQMDKQPDSVVETEEQKSEENGTEPIEQETTSNSEADSIEAKAEVEAKAESEANSKPMTTPIAKPSESPANSVPVTEKPENAIPTESGRIDFSNVNMVEKTTYTGLKYYETDIDLYIDNKKVPLKNKIARIGDELFLNFLEISHSLAMPSTPSDYHEGWNPSDEEVNITFKSDIGILMRAHNPVMFSINLGKDVPVSLSNPEITPFTVKYNEEIFYAPLSILTDYAKYPVNIKAADGRPAIYVTNPPLPSYIETITVVPRDSNNAATSENAQKLGDAGFTVYGDGGFYNSQVPYSLVNADIKVGTVINKSVTITLYNWLDKTAELAKKAFNIYLPTQGDELYNIIEEFAGSNALHYKRSFNMDEHQVIVYYTEASGKVSITIY